MFKYYWFSLIVSTFSLFGSTDNLPWISARPGFELEVVKSFLPDNPTILEAGGHYGEDTELLAKTWPFSTIFSFEPCPAYYSIMEKRVAGYSNIHIYPFGLFTETGYYTFHVSKNWDGASSLLEDSHLPFNIYDDYQITVFCKNLDEWALENGVDHVDYMWLDMEGTELYMLKSSPNILKTIRAISCELNHREFRQGMPNFVEVDEFLTSNGFTLYKIWALQGGDQGTWQSTGIYIRSSLL